MRLEALLFWSGLSCFDRIEIQDKVALYGLGQDLHQADSGDGNVLAQWGDLFTPDAKIDATDAGAKIFELGEYTELMRGKSLVGGTEGLGFSFMRGSTSRDTRR